MENSTSSAATTFTQAAGVVTGLAGVGLSLLTFSNPLLKLLVLLVSCCAGMVMFQGARDRQRGMLSTGMIVWLSAAGLFVLVLVVVLAAQPSPPGQPAAASPAGTSSSGQTMSNQTTKGASPSGTWLADLQTVTKQIDAKWMGKAVQVNGKTHEKSLVAPSIWCYETQLDFVLGGKYNRFTAKVGLADDSPKTEPLTFYVLADDKRVKEASSVGISTTQEIDIPVTGVSRLAIGIEPTPDNGNCPGRDRIGVWIDPLLS